MSASRSLPLQLLALRCIAMCPRRRARAKNSAYALKCLCAKPSDGLALGSPSNLWQCHQLLPEALMPSALAVKLEKIPVSKNAPGIDPRILLLMAASVVAAGTAWHFWGGEQFNRTQQNIFAAYLS